MNAEQRLYALAVIALLAVIAFRVHPAKEPDEFTRDMEAARLATFMAAEQKESGAAYRLVTTYDKSRRERAGR